MRSKKVQDKFFNKTTVTHGSKLECAYSTGHWTGSSTPPALIACELARYNIDIAALSEARLPDEGSLVEMGTGYIFY